MFFPGVLIVRDVRTVPVEVVSNFVNGTLDRYLLRLGDWRRGRCGFVRDRLERAGDPASNRIEGCGELQYTL